MILSKLLNHPKVCVFGGAIRDTLLGQQYRDIDLFYRIPEESMNELKLGTFFSNKSFARECGFRKNTLRDVAREIMLLLIEECNCQNVSVRTVPLHQSYGFSASSNSYQILYDGGKIDLVFLGVNTPKLMDFDINSLYWNDGLKTLIPNKSVDEILYNLSHRTMKPNYESCYDDYLHSDAKFRERESKMEKYGFNHCSKGKEAVTLHCLESEPYLPRIDVVSILPSGYSLTGISRELFTHTGLQCRHVIVYGSDIDVLQAALPFQSTKVNNVLSYPEGSITLVPEEIEEFDGPIRTAFVL